MNEKEQHDPKPSAPNLEAPLSEADMGHIATALFAATEDTQLKNLEIFEEYLYALKKKIYRNEEEFRARFERGYKILIRELVKRAE